MLLPHPLLDLPVMRNHKPVRLWEQAKPSTVAVLKEEHLGA